MELTRTLTLPARPADVQRALGDAALLRACLQGCAVEDAGDGWRVTVEPGLGAAPVCYRVRRRPGLPATARAIDLEADGEGGAAGSRAEFALRLADADEPEATSVGYALRQNFAVGDAPPLLEARFAELADAFWQRFAERLAAPSVAAAATEEARGRRAGNPVVRYVAVAIMIALVAYLYARGGR